MAAALPLQVDIEVEQGVSVFGGPGATAVAVLLLALERLLAAGGVG